MSYNLFHDEIIRRPRLGSDVHRGFELSVAKEIDQDDLTELLLDDTPSNAPMTPWLKLVALVAFSVG